MGTPEDPDQRKWAALYNGVTVLTVSSAVLCAYAILFALIFLAALVFVPGGYFQTILKHPVGFGEYLTLSWLAASLATVAGAIGASLEDEETVREASYGYRQRRRHDAEDNPRTDPPSGKVGGVSHRVCEDRSYTNFVERPFRNCLENREGGLWTLLYAEAQRQNRHLCPSCRLVMVPLWALFGVSKQFLHDVG